VNQQLLFQEQVLGNDCAASSWRKQLGQGSEQVKNEEYRVFHGAKA